MFPFFRRTPAQVVFHVGYPRTATTWLQEDIYPKLPGVNYLGYRYQKSHWYQQDIVNHLIFAEEGAFEPKRIRRPFDRLIKRDLVNVFSSEAFLTPYQVERTALRLREVCGTSWDPRIVIGIRRQDRLAGSLYHHQIRVLGEAFQTGPEAKEPAYTLKACLTAGVDECRWPDCSLSQRIDRQVFKSGKPCRCLEAGCKVMPAWYFDYEKVIGAFEQHFGAGRVHVAVLESVGENPGEVLENLCRFLGLKISPSEIAALGSIPKRNSLMKPQNAPEDPEEGPILAEFLNRFRESNRRLAAARPELNLDRYGFC